MFTRPGTGWGAARVTFSLAPLLHSSNSAPASVIVALFRPTLFGSANVTTTHGWPPQVGSLPARNAVDVVMPPLSGADRCATGNSVGVASAVSPVLAPWRCLR